MSLNIEKRLEYEAESYRNSYGSMIEQVAEEMENRYEGHYSFGTFDEVALGRYAQTWESFIPVFESDMTSRDSLGDILKVGLDLVALQYATLPIQHLASVQPLSEEAGVVYYRRAIATSSRAGVNEGDVLLNATGKLGAGLPDYASEELIDESTTIVDAGGGVPGNGPYNFSLNAPIRPKTFNVNINGNIKGLDDGEGHIFGVGIDPDNSSINYDTGVLVLVLTDATASGCVVGDTITLIYSQNLPSSTEIPGFRYDLVGKVMTVKYHLLQSQYSSLANYVVKRRFGKTLSEDVARDAVAQINGAVLMSAIKKLRTAAIKNETTYGFSTISWAGTAPSGVSDIDHRRTFTDLSELAAAKIEDMSGRSSVTFMIIGQTARQIYSSLGFKGERKAVPGPYLAGYFEGSPVYYAPTSVLPANEIIFGYRGLQWFESPLVYGPFLPTTVVKTAGNPNVFSEAYGVAHGAAMDSVVPEYVVRGKIVP
ncbi:MAG: hypothetical protein DRG78_09450 [Epsilonproteobacteria bacterium]|nr:MAG: hypothetical protein DRG78_09450 [Campylobacterota bacterium]